MSMLNAWSLEPPPPDSTDADITKTMALYKDIANKLEVSLITIHACCTALERWQQRIQHFKDKLTEARMSHASTRSGYRILEQEHRELVAQRAISLEIAPATATRFTQRPQSDFEPLLSSNDPFSDEIWSTFEPERASNDRPTLGQCVENMMELQEPSLVRGRKRKRSESDE